jgi:outer membrane lipoprotein-sorting protein
LVSLLKLNIRFAFKRAATLAVIIGLLTLSPFTVSTASQEKRPEPQKKDEGRVPDQKELEKNRKKSEAIKISPVEAIVEVAILAYGGRGNMEAARKSTHEVGTIRLATDQGDINGTYNLRSMRREKSWEDLLRVDLDLTTPNNAQQQGAAPVVKYTVAYNGASVWSAQNSQYVTPRPDAEAAFRAQLTHDYTTLLRYKEDGSKIELVGSDVVVGIDTHVVDLTLPSGQKTRYWISKEFYRVLHLEYEMKIGEGDEPTKYRISYFYIPFRVVQNTLVPMRRVMYQNGKFVQEVKLTNVSFSAKIEPEVFQHLQEQ